MNPGNLSSADRAQIETFVRGGGHVLVVDDPAWNPDSAISAVTELVGITVEPQRVSSGIYESGARGIVDSVWALPLTTEATGRRGRGNRIARITAADWGLRGGDPFMVDENGLVVAARSGLGTGRMSVFIRGRAFTQLVFGDVWGGVEPGIAKSELYALEYRLIDELLN